MTKRITKILLHRLLPALAFTAAVVALTGCETTGAPHTQPTQSEAAKAQWNAARAAVLAGLAEDQFKTGNFEKSRYSVDQALLLDPHNPTLHLLSAKLAIEQNQLELAEHELDTARVLDLRNGEADYLSGVICQRWQKPDAALEFYTSACEKNPGELAYLLARAEMLAALNRRTEAIALLQERTTYFDHSATLRDAIGELLVQDHQYARAVEALREAAMLASDDESIRLHLAMACLLDQDLREAADLFTRLMRSPAFAARADVHLALGECYMQLSQARDARGEFDAAAGLDPTSTLAWLDLTKCALTLGDLRRAEVSVQRAQSIDPDSADAMLLLGYVRLKQERYPDAMAAFRTASTLDRTDPVSICMMGYVLEKTGRADQAAPYFAKALRLKPDDELASKLMAAVQ
jgi:tetratricopeptide (TPR) repeat protein